MNASEPTQLCLLRHAHAGDPMKWGGPDDVRPLTEKGRLQCERLGLFLAAAGVRPDAIITSPLTRAVETARMVAAPFDIKVKVVDELAGALDLEIIDGILGTAGNPSRPILVGHDPYFSMLAAELAGVGELPIRKAAIVRIDTLRPLAAGQGVLRWLIPPDLLAGEG